VLLATIFANTSQQADWLAHLNFVYAMIWIASVALTYSAMRMRNLPLREL
jgi:uncharacterized membrane protein SirB2